VRFPSAFGDHLCEDPGEGLVVVHNQDARPTFQRAAANDLSRRGFAEGILRRGQEGGAAPFHLTICAGHAGRIRSGSLFLRDDFRLRDERQKTLDCSHGLAQYRLRHEEHEF
jgi:hypothetical protein